MPFASPEGFHILMLTDRRCESPIPFADIKDSLAANISQMERAYFLMRLLGDLYEEFKHPTTEFDDLLK